MIASKLTNGKSLKPGIFYRPGGKKWKKIQKVAGPNGSVYWRVIGATAKGGNEVESDRVSEIRITP